MTVSKDDYKEGYYDILGREINNGNSGKSTGQICPIGYILDTTRSYGAKPHLNNGDGSTNIDQRTLCIGKDSSGGDVGDGSYNITKEACTLSNKANVFGSDTNRVLPMLNLKERVVNQLRVKSTKMQLLERSILVIVRKLRPLTLPVIVYKHLIRVM